MTLLPPLISFQNVSKNFGTHQVHKGISFDIFPGEVVSILGPSGTGKTVLLKLIIGLLFADRGKITVLGTEIDKATPQELQKIRQDIGMLFQGAALFDSITVFDNIAFPLRQAKQFRENELAPIVKEKLALVGLEDSEAKLPGSLSGGQRKRVGLARALATSPRVLLFDEPTTGLDPTSRAMIDNLIISLREDFGITSVVVTHEMESAKRTSNRIILIADGEVVVSGKVEELWDINSQVKKFVNGRWF
jgi:phospholipid/cholesterol/gamma-HCH transport system ATP-binding protein